MQAEQLDRLKAALADRYRLQRVLGTGGMATVYLAEDLKHHRQVAIKVLKPELAAMLGPERFLREIEIAATLNHPNISPLYDSGDAAGLLHYVMPYLEGGSLRERLNRERQLSIEDAIQVTREVGDALAYAHSRGIIHRDIKPENVLFQAGHAVLSDFGIARAVSAAGGRSLTEPGMAVGTSTYMSPEQASGGPEVDARSDIYGLACVLYEMLAGQPPFTGPTADSVLRQHLAAPPPSASIIRPAVSGRVGAVVQRAMAKTPADRFSTAAEFVTALTTVRPTPGTPAHATSLVVLPFVNRSADPENEYFSDGLSEVLINALSKVTGFQVAARTSAFSFKGRDVDVREVGRTLDAANVLEGSVQRVGNRLRITAELISVQDGYHLWSEQYDRVLADVFAIQDEITLAIVDALKLQLLASEATAVTKRHTENVNAYQLYLKGRYYWNQRSTPAFRKAIDHFEAAIVEDPDYALAYAGLADAFALIGDAGHTALPPKEAFSKATAAVLRALELDDELAEAHTSLGHLRMHQFDWAEAEREFKRAISLNRNYATAYHWYAIYLALQGQLEDAILTIRRALELDPVSRPINTDLGVLFYYGRQFDRAIAQYRTTLEMDPGFGRAYTALGSAYAQQRAFDDAVRMYQKAIELSGDRATIAGLGRAYALAGRTDDALGVIAELQQLSKERYITPYSIVLIYACLGLSDEAFEWLERAGEEGVGELIYLNVDPFLDNLRSDPRFAAILRRVGFKE